MNKHIEVITNQEGKRIVVISDVWFKGKTTKEWAEIEKYLKEYVGKYYEIVETSEKIYIGKDFPDEFVHGKDKTILKGPNAKAKANASRAVKELIQIATNKTFAQDYNSKHRKRLNMVGIVMTQDWHYLYTMIRVKSSGIIYINSECL